MPEIQDVLNAVYLKGLSDIQYKAFYSIKGCRTSSHGSHADVCDNCGHVEISYNSCRNRNCPKCQGSRQEEWVEAQLERLLTVGYFHLVFTLPHELNAIVPFRAPIHVVRYLGRYTHRVAITNSRILSFDGHTVVFRWKDYRDGGKQKAMSLSASEFVRRFLQHVLPHRFVKLRHYGIFSNRMIGARFLLCMKLAGSNMRPAVKKRTYTLLCPVCKTGIMVFSGIVSLSVFRDP